MINTVAKMVTDKPGLWKLHANLKRRKSPNGINLVFVPGQNVVLELNEVAGDVMEAFVEGPITYQSLMHYIKRLYDTDDVPEFQSELDQLLERFAKHGVIVPVEADAVGDRIEECG